MKNCPVCSTQVEDLYTGLCTNSDCTWKFEFIGAEPTPEIRNKYKEKLNKAKSLYFKLNEDAINNDDFVVLIEGKELLVAFTDFQFPMSWQEATNCCKELGDGWRLPSFDELKQLFYHKEKGNFKDFRYWTSDYPNRTHAWNIDFTTGISFYYCSKDNFFLARAVKEINQSLRVQ